jgi:hypothetical protein
MALRAEHVDPLRQSVEWGKRVKKRNCLSTLPIAMAEPSVASGHERPRARAMLSMLISPDSVWAEVAAPRTVRNPHRFRSLQQHKKAVVVGG